MNQDSRTRKRLELTRMIREENKNNQIRINDRENIFYGYLNSAANSPEETEQMSTFGLRFLLAVFLFGIYFVCKTQDISFAGISSEQIENTVAAQDSSKIIDFIDQFTYTLHDS